MRVLRAFVVAAAVTCSAPLSYAQKAQQHRDAGMAALAQGDLSAAERNLADAENDARGLGTESRIYAESKLNLAALNLLQWRFDEADAMFHDATRLMQAAGVDTVNNPEFRLIEARLGMAESNMKQADTGLDTTVRLAERNFGKDHPKTAEILTTLGELRLIENAPAEAASYLRDALGILNETYGPEFAGTVAVYRLTAMVLLTEGKYPEALKYAQTAVTMAEMLGPAGRLQLGEALLALGGAQSALGRSEDARSNAMRGLNRMSEVYGRDSLRLVPFLTTLAGISLHAHDISSAGEFINRALAIYKVNSPADWLPAAQAFRVAAATATLSGKPQEAIPHLQKAREITESRLGQTNLLAADISETLGDALLASKDGGQAETAYRRAMELRQQQLSSGHPDLARSYVDMAQVHQLRGEPELAEPFYAKAVGAIENQWGNDSFLLIPTLESYEAYLRSRQRSQEALKLEQRITRLREMRQR